MAAIGFTREPAIDSPGKQRSTMEGSPGGTGQREAGGSCWLIAPFPGCGGSLRPGDTCWRR